MGPAFARSLSFPVLRTAGIFERMEALGVKDGDTVSLYDIEFEYKD